MSKKIKQLAKSFMKTRVQGQPPENDLFQGTPSSSSRRRELLKHLPPELQGRPIAFQRDDVGRQEDLVDEGEREEDREDGEEESEENMMDMETDDEEGDMSGDEESGGGESRRGGSGAGGSEGGGSGAGGSEAGGSGASGFGRVRRSRRIHWVPHPKAP
jgi:hypothetical protein